MLLCRKITLSSFSGEILLLLSWETRPATEKTLSEDAEVARIQRYFCASLERFGYWDSFRCHHCKGSFSNSNSDSMKYVDNSINHLWSSWCLFCFIVPVKLIKKREILTKKIVDIIYLLFLTWSCFSIFNTFCIKIRIHTYHLFHKLFLQFLRFCCSIHVLESEEIKI